MSINKTPNAQMLNKSICVIGGGIAGLSAAVFLVEKGFKVSLIESSPKLGGRAYSFFDKYLNQYLDNGQHIFASWYKNTFDFLNIIGTCDNLRFQKSLNIKFIDSDSKQYEFKCPDWKPPYHLIWGLFRYSALRIKDKLSVIRLIRLIKSNKAQNEDFKSSSVSRLFETTEQTDRIITYFWNPFLVAIFNATPENVSAVNFVEILKMGLYNQNCSQLVFPAVDLNTLFVNPTIEYLKRGNACIKQSMRAVKLNVIGNCVKSITLENGNELGADYIISAVPYYDLKDLVRENIFNDNFIKLNNLKCSPILNIHHVFERNNGNDFLDFNFAGILNSPLQWIFNNADNRICLVVSSADKLIDMDKKELIEMSKKELIKCLPEFKNVNFIYSKVVKEKRATFLPDVDSLHSRPENKTKYENLFIAGDWTDTGYPATIESAVTSARNCVNEIVKHIIS